MNGKDVFFAALMQARSYTLIKGMHFLIHKLYADNEGTKHVADSTQWYFDSTKAIVADFKSAINTQYVHVDLTVDFNHISLDHVLSFVTMPEAFNESPIEYLNQLLTETVSGNFGHVKSFFEILTLIKDIPRLSNQWYPKISNEKATFEGALRDLQTNMELKFDTEIDKVYVLSINDVMSAINIPKSLESDSIKYLKTIIEDVNRGSFSQFKNELEKKLKMKNNRDFTIVYEKRRSASHKPQDNPNQKNIEDEQSFPFVDMYLSNDAIMFKPSMTSVLETILRREDIKSTIVDALYKKFIHLANTNLDPNEGDARMANTNPMLFFEFVGFSEYNDVYDSLSSFPNYTPLEKYMTESNKSTKKTIYGFLVKQKNPLNAYISLDMDRSIRANEVYNRREVFDDASLLVIKYDRSKPTRPPPGSDISSMNPFWTRPYLERHPDEWESFERSFQWMVSRIHLPKSLSEKTVLPSFYAPFSQREFDWSSLKTLGSGSFGQAFSFHWYSPEHISSLSQQKNKKLVKVKRRRLFRHHNMLTDYLLNQYERWTRIERYKVVGAEFAAQELMEIEPLLRRIEIVFNNDGKIERLDVDFTTNKMTLLDFATIFLYLSVAKRSEAEYEEKKMSDLELIVHANKTIPGGNYPTTKELPKILSYVAHADAFLVTKKPMNISLEDLREEMIGEILASVKTANLPPDQYYWIDPNPEKRIFDKASDAINVNPPLVFLSDPTQFFSIEQGKIVLKYQEGGVVYSAYENQTLLNQYLPETYGVKLPQIMSQSIMPSFGRCYKYGFFFNVTPIASNGTLTSFLKRAIETNDLRGNDTNKYTWDYIVVKKKTSVENNLTPPRPLSLYEYLNILLDVTRGLQYLARVGLEHYDFKHDNILIDNRRGYVADLGSVAPYGCNVNLTYTPWYASETFRHIVENHIPYCSVDANFDTYTLGSLMDKDISEGVLPKNEIPYFKGSSASYVGTCMTPEMAFKLLLEGRSDPILSSTTRIINESHKVPMSKAPINIGAASAVIDEINNLSVFLRINTSIPSEVEDMRNIHNGGMNLSEFKTVSQWHGPNGQRIQGVNLLRYAECVILACKEAIRLDVMAYWGDNVIDDSYF